MSSLENVFWLIVLLGVPWMLFFGGYLAAPVFLAWSWVLWVRHPRQWTPSAILSFAGLTFALVSAVVAGSLMMYSISMGGDFLHHFDDPLFMKMFRWGGLLSRIGTV